MGGQVEVNKEMVGMEREEMRVVLCEDDLASSQEKNGEGEEHSGGGERKPGTRGWDKVWRGEYGRSDKLKCGSKKDREGERRR